MQEYHHADSIITNNAGHSLWIGDLNSAQDLPWIKDNNIQTVITVAVGFTLNYPSTITHHTFNLLDGKAQNVLSMLNVASTLIARSLSKGSVLVHCSAGVSRSPTFVIAYLINTKKMDFSMALKYCKLYRPQICPNIGFQRQLKQYAQLQQNKTNYFTDWRKLRNPPSRRYPSLLNMREKRSHKSVIHHRQETSNADQAQKAEYLARLAKFRFGVAIGNPKTDKIKYPTKYD